MQVPRRADPAQAVDEPVRCGSGEDEAGGVSLNRLTSPIAATQPRQCRRRQPSVFWRGRKVAQNRIHGLIDQPVLFLR